MRELEAQAKALAPVFGRLLEKAASDLREEFKAQIAERDSRIEALQKALEAQPSVELIAEQAAALVPVPKNGEDGASADMDALKSHLEELVKAIPAPQDGKSVTIDDLTPMIREEAAKAVYELPPAKDGESVTAEDVRPMLAEMVGEAVKAIPPAEAGKDADMGALKTHLSELVKGIQVHSAPSVQEIADAVSAGFERRFSDQQLSWERLARETLEKAADRMPVPKDGRDALSLESFDMELGEDGRTVTVKMQAGEVVIEKSVKIASVIDRGVYSAEKCYEQGDGTTYGGCYWIAQKDAPGGVPGGSADWRLAVKKGRDGKDLRDSASRHDPKDPVKI